MNDRLLNESAIREHALRCSKELRAGRFTRVGEDFISEVKVDVEAIIRGLNEAAKTQLHDPLATELNFTTGALLERAQPILNGLISRIIQNKVQRQPSVGVTLGRTR